MSPNYALALLFVLGFHSSHSIENWRTLEVPGIVGDPPCSLGEIYTCIDPPERYVWHPQPKWDDEFVKHGSGTDIPLTHSEWQVP